MKKSLLLVLWASTATLVHSCLPQMGCGGLGGCSPFPPPPPVQQPACGCDSTPACGPCVMAALETPQLLPQQTAYVAPPPQLSPIAAGNNFFAQYPAPAQEFSPQPVAIPMQPTPPPIDENVQRDHELRKAIAEFNAKERTNVPFPDAPNATTVEPPAVDFSGLPSIYFTPADGGSPALPTKSTKKPPTSSTTSRPNARAHAFASETHWAVLSERQTEDGRLEQEKVPYNVYRNEACTGATLGRSIEKTVADAAAKCTSLGCAAANLRALDSERFEVIYLKGVEARRKLPSSPYSCISIVDVPQYESVYRKQEREQKEPTMRFVTVEPKGAY